jgi:hypothetical protein
MATTGGHVAKVGERTDYKILWRNFLENSTLETVEIG